ncbi:MAG: hypothetical protein LBF86_02950 [Helicobacteraceae bacterium]|nr:hypothetical protein [Helicobacteraceae bacterium]
MDTAINGRAKTVKLNAQTGVGVLIARDILKANDKTTVISDLKLESKSADALRRSRAAK